MGTLNDATPDPDHPGWDDDFQHAGEAAEPYRCHPAQFPFVTVSRPAGDPPWPHVVAVCGGVQYCAADGAWVVAKYLNATAAVRQTNALHTHVSPTAGACSLVYREMLKSRRPVGMSWFAEQYGRAAAMRTAWDLLSAADSVVLFEPADELARHVVDLARFVETRWGRGLRVVRVAARGG